MMWHDFPGYLGLKECSPLGSLEGTRLPARMKIRRVGPSGAPPPPPILGLAPPRTARETR